MDKFDTIQYGNGLSIAALSNIREISANSKVAKYLNCNTFISDFAFAESHKRISRKFDRYFELNEESLEMHQKARNILKEHCQGINELDFERWVSKHFFEKNQKLEDFRLYAYILYNYWYHVVDREILGEKLIVQYIDIIAEKIQEMVKDKGVIYTTNFDTLLDKKLMPKHIHGTFHLPLDRVKISFCTTTVIESLSTSIYLAQTD